MTEPLPPSSRHVFNSPKIAAELLDPEAIKVIHRLKQFGFEAYLVGGCVRDLLLGHQPKDFDVASSARPRQIKRVFKNCRIIGRRFKLAHIVFGGKIIETATFRKSPSNSPAGSEKTESEIGTETEVETPLENVSENLPLDAEPTNNSPENTEIPDTEPETPETPEIDLLIREDNIFGNAEEDARRRDFTINALFFDPETQEVIDYVGGFADLEQKKIRTIGDPWVRFREDPVRILRAVKFATRLNFQIEESAFQAMKEISADLVRSAAPRILEEILRLLRSGSATQSFRLLREIGALKIILPEIEEFLAQEEVTAENQPSLAEQFWRSLEILDERVRAGQTPTTALGLGCIYLHLYFRRLAKSQGSPFDAGRVANEIVMPLARRTRLPRFDSGRLQRICVVQKRFTQRPGRRFRPNRFVHQDYFEEALALFEIYSRATGMNPEIHASWVQRQNNPHSSPFRGNASQRPQNPRPNFPQRSRAPQHPAPRRRPADKNSDPDSALLRDEEKDPTWGDW